MKSVVNEAGVKTMAPTRAQEPGLDQAIVVKLHRQSRNFRDNITINFLN